MVTKITKKKPKQKDNYQLFFSAKNCSASTVTISAYGIVLVLFKILVLEIAVFPLNSIIPLNSVSVNNKVEACRKNIFEFFTLTIIISTLRVIYFFIVLFSHSIKSYEVNENQEVNNPPDKYVAPLCIPKSYILSIQESMF